jgi:predicted transcriptional regulator
LEKHDLKQKETVRLLGIDQAATSKHVRSEFRALKLKDLPEVQSLVERAADRLIEEGASKPKLMPSLCKACTIVRKEGLGS